MPEPYEQLKALTRGKTGMTRESLRAFIEALALPDDAKARLHGADAGKLRRSGGRARQADLAQRQRRLSSSVAPRLSLRPSRRAVP